MKVVCINNELLKSVGGNRGLTLHKTYDVLSVRDSKPYLTIINDFGEMHDYRTIRFISLEEWREMRINKLLE